MKKSILAIFIALASCKTPPPEYDILLSRGMIVDGLGNPRFLGDVAVKGNKIVKISATRIDPAKADTVLDLHGKIVSSISKSSPACS
mgnify:FL=1